MSAALLPVLVAGGGVAWIATQGPKAPTPTPTNLSPSGSPLGPPLPSQPVSKAARMAALNVAAGANYARPQVQGGSNYRPSPHLAPSNTNSGLNAQVQEKLLVVEQYAKAVYSKLEGKAKAEGAKALNNALGLNPPLKEDSSWGDVAAAVGGAAGAAAGAWIGGPIGAKLGAIVGAYLGVKLEEFLSKHVDEIKAWFASKWADVKAWVGDVASDAYDYTVGAAADAVGELFEDIF